MGPAVDAAQGEVQGAFCYDPSRVAGGDENRERIARPAIGDMKVCVGVDGIAALRWYIVHDGRPCISLEKVLHAYLGSLDGIRVLQGEEFLEVGSSASFGKVPGGAGGDVLLRGSPAEDIKVLR